jgi:hypothetical protein
MVSYCEYLCTHAEHHVCMLESYGFMCSYVNMLMGLCVLM